MGRGGVDRGDGARVLVVGCLLLRKEQLRRRDFRPETAILARCGDRERGSRCRCPGWVLHLYYIESVDQCLHVKKFHVPNLGMTYLPALSPLLNFFHSSCTLLSLRLQTQKTISTVAWSQSPQKRRPVAEVGMSPAAAEDLLGRLQYFPGYLLALAWHQSRRLQTLTRHGQSTQRGCYQMPLRGAVRAGFVEWPLRPTGGLTHLRARHCLRQSPVRSISPSCPLLMRRSQS